MDNQTENTALAEEKTDKQKYQTPNPKAADAERKWQLVSLLTGILLIAAVAIIGWQYLETNSTGALRGKLEMENQSLREQVNLAGTQITGLKNEMETLLNRNIELAAENMNLKPQTPASIAGSPIKGSNKASVNPGQSASSLKGATKQN